MNDNLGQAWDARVARLLVRLPLRIQSSVAWLRTPSRKLVRLLAAVGLVIGGVLAVLPVFGLWMLPLGLALMSDDIPGLKPPLERGARWLGRCWRRLRGRPV